MAEPGEPGATQPLDGVGDVVGGCFATAAIATPANMMETKAKRNATLQCKRGFGRCNDARSNCFHAGRTAHSRRLLGLGLQALARIALSGGPAAKALVRALCGGIR